MNEMETDKALDETEVEKPERSLLKGAVAGLIGGLAGAGAKLLAEKVFPPREESRISPPVALVERAAGHPLTEEQRSMAESAIHWGFGAAAGAVYGAMAEEEPTLGAWKGAAFGLALNRLTHEAVLPKLGVVPAKSAQAPQERLSEWVTHAVYGVVTDLVRRGVRRAL
jgi:putative membrane protein